MGCQSPRGTRRGRGDFKASESEATETGETTNAPARKTAAQREKRFAPTAQSIFKRDSPPASFRQLHCRSLRHQPRRRLHIPRTLTHAHAHTHSAACAQATVTIRPIFVCPRISPYIMQRRLPPHASASAPSSSASSVSSATATQAAAAAVSATSSTSSSSSDGSEQQPPLSSPALWRRKTTAAASSPFSPSSASASANRAPVDEHAYLIRVVAPDVVVFWRATRWQHVCEYSWGPRAHAALPDRYQSALVVCSWTFVCLIYLCRHVSVCLSVGLILFISYFLLYGVYLAFCLPFDIADGDDSLIC